MLAIQLKEQIMIHKSDYNKFTNNILDTKITVKNVFNECGLNEKIKILTTKEEIKKISDRDRIKIRAR